MESQGIKESLELLKGLEVLIQDYKKVMADGKVNVQDLAVLGDLMGQLGVLSEAYKGLDLIGKEIKDLDEAEMVQLAVAALALVKSFKK